MVLSMAAAGDEPTKFGDSAPSSEVTAGVPPGEPNRRHPELMSLDRAWLIMENPRKAFGFTTHNDADSAYLRCCNEGGEAGMPYVDFTDSCTTLQQLFGEPVDRASRDVTTEWIVAFGPEEVAHVYDWRATNRYAEDKPSVEELRDLQRAWWRVSARDDALIDRIVDIIKVQWNEAKFVRFSALS